MSLITGIGDPAYEGYLEKKGGGTSTFGRRNYARRWFVLHNNVLSYFKTPDDKMPAGQVELTGCRLETESSMKHDHHLTLHTANGRAFEVRVPPGTADAAQVYADFKEAVRRIVVEVDEGEL